MKKRVIAEMKVTLRLDYDPTTDETWIYADVAPVTGDGMVCRVDSKQSLLNTGGRIRR